VSRLDGRSSLRRMPNTCAILTWDVNSWVLKATPRDAVHHLPIPAGMSTARSSPQQHRRPHCWAPPVFSLDSESDASDAGTVGPPA
jgi:hypothetical protein